MAEKSLGNGRAAPNSALVQHSWVLPLRGRARPPFARTFAARMAANVLANGRAAPQSALELIIKRRAALAQQAWVLPLRGRARPPFARNFSTRMAAKSLANGGCAPRSALEVVILVVAVLSKLTVPAAKAVINKSLPAFRRAFAAGTDNFDKKLSQ